MKHVKLFEEFTFTGPIGAFEDEPYTYEEIQGIIDNSVRLGNFDKKINKDKLFIEFDHFDDIDDNEQKKLVDGYVKAGWKSVTIGEYEGNKGIFFERFPRELKKK